MSHVFVEFNGNWADEIDIHGFKIMTLEEFNNWKTVIENSTDEVEAGIGSNEWVGYSDGKSYLGDIYSKEISDEDAEVILRVFNKYPHIYKQTSFYTFVDFADFVECPDEDIDD